MTACRQKVIKKSKVDFVQKEREKNRETVGERKRKRVTRGRGEEGPRVRKRAGVPNNSLDYVDCDARPPGQPPAPLSDTAF